jgi:hypothetical protein
MRQRATSKTHRMWLINQSVPTNTCLGIAVSPARTDHRKTVGEIGLEPTTSRM